MLVRLQPSRIWQPVCFWIIAVLAGVALSQWSLLWSAALLGGTAIFLLTLIQPLFGLGLTLLLGPLGALENILFGRAIVDSGQLMLMFTLAAWLGRGVLRRSIILPSTFLNLPLWLFIFVAALTLVDAPSLELGLKELLKWLEISLIMWLVVNLAGGEVTGRRAGERCPAPKTQNGMRDRPYTYITWIVAMLLLAGLSQGLVGLWQFGWRGTGPEHFAILGRFYRAYGSFEQPNPFGGFMNLTALPALGMLIGLVAGKRVAGAGVRGSRGEGVKEYNIRAPAPLHLLLFVAIGAGVTTLALIFSWSRGAWLGLAAGAAVLVLFWPTKRWRGLTLVGLVVALFFLGIRFNLAPASVTNRIGTFSEDLRFGDVRGVDINDANYAVLERLAHWQAALEMARHQPWLGVGFGNYEAAYPAFALINWPDALGHAHNYYLNLLAETGVVGLAAYLFFWAAVFWQTLTVLGQLKWPERGIALGLLAAWVALATHHLVDKLYVNNIYIHLGVMLGLLQLLEDKQCTS
jgi:O-antigen ligase